VLIACASFYFFTEMSEMLWVEYKTEERVYLHRISLEDCEFVAHFVDRVRSDPQLGIPRSSRTTLYGPSGTAISPAEPISVLIPGNSSKNPLHVQVSALPPITTGPVLDALLTSFWSSLHGLQDEKGILRFPVAPEFFPVHLKILYIRQSYKDMFNIICKNLKPKDPTKRHNRMVITGTPGIGKNVFLFYIIWRLANMKGKRTVILHREMDLGKIYVFQNDGCWTTLDDKYIRHFLDNPTTWHLVDAFASQPGDTSAVTILVTSPAGRYYEKVVDYSGSAPLHFLPTWSLEELNRAAPYYKIKPELVESRFAKIGGVPRYVLEDDGDLEMRIKRSIGRLDLDGLPSVALSKRSKEEEITHLIVRFEIDPTYLDFKLNIASDYVMDEIVAKHVGTREPKLRNFIDGTVVLPTMRGAYARAFEGYAHGVLSRGGKFLARSLEDDGKTHELILPTMTFMMFSDISECTNPEAYYRSMKVNHPCFDSIILNVGYFQMTTTQNHPIRGGQLREVVERFGMDKFYFVVPDTNFGEFQKQKFEGDMENVKAVKSTEVRRSSRKRPLKEIEHSNKNKKQRPKKVGENDTVLREDLVRQFVISIPI
jgi:hypothetical protein